MKIHKEGKVIVRNTAIICVVILGLCAWLVGFNWILAAMAVVLIGLFLFVCRFFRVPQRTPVVDPGAVIAPADGTIVIIQETDEPEYLKTQCRQVSIFMSIYNVHINWFPVKGTVEFYRYHPGKYLVAWHPKSSTKNERTTVVVNTNGTKILFRQIAGFLARRIVCYAAEGKQVEQGMQTGFIKFGSRVDLFLPLDAEICVKEGDKVTGSQTAIARLKN